VATKLETHLPLLLSYEGGLDGKWDEDSNLTNFLQHFISLLVHLPMLPSLRLPGALSLTSRFYLEMLYLQRFDPTLPG
jgi:hypothetical protein